MRRIIQKLIRLIQNIFLTAALFIIYIVMFGFTFLFIFIFKRKLLIGDNEDNVTFWQTAEGYEENMDSCLRES